MAGGTFTAMNKVRPGVYINFATSGAPVVLGERGTVALALPLSWGAPTALTVLDAGEDTTAKLGYSLAAPEMLLVREAFKRASRLLLYRLNGGTAAKVTSGTLTATAKYAGVRGNALSIVIAASVDKVGQFDVTTMLEGATVNKQTVANIAGLAATDWIVWSGTGELAATAGAPLIGGADGTVTNQNYTDFLAAIELQDFNTVVYTGTDAVIKGLFAAFVRRMREDEGRKIQTVLENYTTANDEGVISVKNGVKLDNGTVLSAGQTAVWAAAATAAAAANESLTYSRYEGAVDASPRLTSSATTAALQGGEFLFTARGGGVVVEQDINSYRTPTAQKGKVFGKNAALRVLDGLANDFKNTFESFYIGKMANNDNGRSLFRKDCVKLMEQYQSIGAIQNFDSAQDIGVSQGAEPDTVVVNASVQPVDSIEKIYMKVQVK
ncbi:Phage tail sheath protein [Paenibacillus sp. RU4T]|nr:MULTISPECIES: phage tail sheath family protein [unclassified Paenibacillus]ASS66479.1 phage tail sheath protein [Paenibacillus sp. RUD330]SIQ03117.1 Phage tail sheath protein [Paenibacillus sp. RU4X]SIQ22790.1 Phage tail sheath protein [Paenibacillus sp. RU4T]